MARVAVGLAVPAGSDPAVFRGAMRISRMIGLDSFMLFDHFQDFASRSMWRSNGYTWMAKKQASPHDQMDPFVVLASLARSAGHVRLGVSVTEPLRNHPVSIARSGATLASMTRRRPIVGVGAGERMNTEPYGIDFTGQVSRTGEALAVLNMCISRSESITHHGRYFNLADAPVDLTNDSSLRPEIWVAAQGPRMLELAARYGDGWLPAFGPSPDRYETAHVALSSFASDAGRDPAAITASLQSEVLLTPSRDEAQRLMKTSRFVRYNAVAAWPAAMWGEVGAQHPFGSDYRGFTDLIPERVDSGLIEAAIERVPDEVLRNGLLWGTAEDIARSIRELETAGLQHISLVPTSYPISKRLANYMWWSLRRIARILRS